VTRPSYRTPYYSSAQKRAAMAAAFDARFCYFRQTRPLPEKCLRVVTCPVCKERCVSYEEWEFHGDRVVFRGHRRARTRPQSFSLLLHLVLRGEKFLSGWDEMIEWVYPDPDLEPDNSRRNLDVALNFLRKSENSLGIHVLTFSGRGLEYRRLQ